MLQLIKPLALLGSASLLTLAVLGGCADDPAPGAGPPATQAATGAPPGFVGRQTCAPCHPAESRAWEGSHHDLAMQPATEATVLGDFDGAELEHYGTLSRMFRRDGGFWVRTDGPDGEMAEYEVAYTFGAEPLQQYLVAFPGGRFQTLPLCWDTRPAEEGGQRWFHIYPDEDIPHDDVLHWSGPNQNWNFMCAECHSTGLRKNYDLAGDAYQTSWSEIDVSCEACHGPASGHLEWAKQAASADGGAADPLKGLVVDLSEPDNLSWNLQPDTGNARRSPARTSHAQLETCARCHSRRSPLTAGYVHGEPFLDHYRLQLLEDGLYHADGQILEEVYVHGSFLQSRMHAEGVTCSDCHDPHSLKLKREGNALCTQCHFPAKYDVPAHHHHEAGTPAAECVACHMDDRDYMVVDPRRDHSFRVPRPDLSAELGVPNACNRCHDDRSAEWAAERVVEWYGDERERGADFARAFAAAWEGLPRAGMALEQVIADEEVADFVRASALRELHAYLGASSVAVLERALKDDSALVRAAALTAAEALPPEARLRLAGHLLDDSVRLVRTEAARVLASVPAEAWDEDRLTARDRAVAEFEEVQSASADRAGSHLNLGVLYAQLGRAERAEAAYRTAMEVQPDFVEAYVNLADLYRESGRDEESEEVLREAIARRPEAAATHHALGLALVRLGRRTEALEELGRAAGLAPDNTRYAYVFAVALLDSGDARRAVAVLRDAHSRRPYDVGVLMELVRIHRDQQDFDAALRWAAKLVQLDPQDQTYQGILLQLQDERRAAEGGKPPR